MGGEGCESGEHGNAKTGGEGGCGSVEHGSSVLTFGSGVRMGTSSVRSDISVGEISTDT